MNYSASAHLLAVSLGSVHVTAPTLLAPSLLSAGDRYSLIVLGLPGTETVEDARLSGMYRLPVSATGRVKLLKSLWINSAMNYSLIQLEEYEQIIGFEQAVSRGIQPDSPKLFKVLIP